MSEPGLEVAALRLRVLYEAGAGGELPLPAGLTEVYGGGFELGREALYANFVSSIDGVVALQRDGDSGPVISQKSEVDRFVMGLLRACADAVLVGAGTFRKATGHLWHAEAIYPPAAALFREARRRLGLSAHPKLVLVSASGELDVREPALRDAIVYTSAHGARALQVSAPELTCFVREEAAPLRELVEHLRSLGLKRVLTEGGPSLFAQLVSEQLVDELFLTAAPTLFGHFPNDQRKSLTHGLDLFGTSLELQSLRHHRSHLFLRYAFQHT